MGRKKKQAEPTEFVTLASSALASANYSTQTAFVADAKTNLRATNNVLTGYRKPNQRWANLIADVCGLDQEERTKLHIAAARANGYEIDLDLTKKK